MTATAPPPTQRVMTASATTALRRGAFWAAAAVFALIIGIIGILFAGSFAQSDPLSATNPAPAGA